MKQKILTKFATWILGMVLIAIPQSMSAQKYKVDYKGQPLEKVIKDLRQLTGLEFVYNRQLLSAAPTISATCGYDSVKDLLDRVIVEEAGFDYEIVKNTVVLKRADSKPGNYVIAGTVIDEQGEPMPWASIMLKESKESTATDADGRFELHTTSPRSTLEIGYIGFNSQTKIVRGSQKDLRIVMHEDRSQLDEVVVTGYQVLNKRSLTSAVTTAKMDDIARTDMTSLDQMLEGRIADLMVTTNSAEAGVAPKIRIRGTSTLIGNREPLWVVDGIVVKDPVEISPEELNDPDYVNRIGNAIAGINPQDIERIDVLKDAAATAIYGTKAANGVIVVTTKRGTEGKPQVSYNVSTTYKRRPRYTDKAVDVMNSLDRVQFSRELYQDHYVYPSNMTTVGYEDALLQLYNGKVDYAGFEQLVGQAETRNTDWFDLLTRDSWSSQHTASVSGGSKKSRYYASLGYTKDSDVIKVNNNERYTWTMNIDNTFSKLLTASFSFYGNHYQRNGYQDEIAPLNYAYTASRTIPVYDANGEYAYYGRKTGSNGYEYNYNILNELDNSYRKQVVNAMTFTSNLKFTLTDWLRANAILSVTHQNTDIEGWWGEKTAHASALRHANYGETIVYNELSELPQGGELSKNTVRDRNYTVRLQMDANKYFGPDDRHNIDATLGFEMNSDKYRNHSSVARGYFRDRGESFVTDISTTKYPGYAAWLASNVPSITDNLTNEVSAYMSVTYAYRQLWRINLNGRVDGSNKFGDRANDRFLPIWSLSGSYNVGHWIDARWIDYITAKASYGFQGNMLNTENPLMTIRKGSMSDYYNEYLSSIEQRPNPDLKWEKTSSWNVGLDMSFLDHRLGVELSAYYKRTKDAFMNKRISTVNGISSYVINGGDVTNKGYSVDLSYTPIRNRDFRWTLSTSISKIINTLDTRPDAQTYDLNDFLTGNALVEGKSVNTFYSYRFLGLSPVDGGPLFDDYFNNQEALRGLSKYDTYTTVLEASGKRDADIQGSLTNTFRYKQWHASVNIGYSFGAKTRLFAMYGSAASGGAYDANIYSEKNYSNDYTNRWKQPGDEAHTTVPALITSNSSAYWLYTNVWCNRTDNIVSFANNYWDMYDYSNLRVVSADYVKLQSLSVTYEMPTKWLDRMHMQRLAFTLSAYNLFTIADSALKGQTPTQGGFSTIQLSDRPSFSLGMNVIF